MSWKGFCPCHGRGVKRMEGRKERGIPAPQEREEIYLRAACGSLESALREVSHLSIEDGLDEEDWEAGR